MKKFLISITGILAAIIMLPAVSFAASNSSTISGTVTNNGKPVNGASVTVVCNNNVKKTKTTAAGAYSVTYKPASLCPNGAKATVVATLKKKGGVNTGTVLGNGTDHGVINVAIINVDLPEYGVVIGGIAAILGAGAFLVIRRRQLGAN